jgi:biotin carboxylase
MGLHVVVSDRNPQAPGFAWADDRLLVSTYDVEGTVAAARRYHQTTRPLNGVMCLAADVPLTVAAVAAALGLPGIGLEAARLATDKLAMKRKFAADRVPIPWFCRVESLEHLRGLVAEQGLPLVLKPVDSRGARGVLRLTPDTDLAWAYQESLGHSPTGRVMVERFLPGPQVSTESILLDGTAYTPGFSDRNYEYLERFAPHIIENGGELPSFLPPAVQDAVQRVVRQAAISMGIANGVVKGDIVVSDGEVYVIELAARLSGGYFCTHEIPLNTGVNFVKQAILLALGEKPDPADLLPRWRQGVAQRYLFPPPGRVVRITGVDEAARRPEIALCEVRVRKDDLIPETDSHPARAGVIIATGATRQEAVAHAVAAVNRIHIETVPVS